MNKILSVLVIFLFTGCFFKEIHHTEKPVVLTIKSNKFKFNDLATIKTNEKISIDGYFIGNKVFEMLISHNICINKKCLTPELFNKEFLHKSYNDNFIKNIFTKNKIFDGVNLKYNKNGFTQIIHTSYYNITYKVTNDNLYFKDKKNKVLIKIRNIKI